MKATSIALLLILALTPLLGALPKVQAATTIVLDSTQCVATLGGTWTVDDPAPGLDTCTISSSYTLIAGDTLQIASPAILSITGTLTNQGTIGTGFWFSVVNTGTFNNAGLIDVSGCSLDNQAAGTLDNSGTITVDSGACMTNEGVLTNEASGTITNNFALVFSNAGTLTNYGTLTNNYDFANSGTVDVYGTLQNPGEIDNSGTIVIKCGGQLVGTQSSIYNGTPLTQESCSTTTSTSTTTGVGVPEFPLGLTLLFALMFSVMLVLRAWRVGVLPTRV